MGKIFVTSDLHFGHDRPFLYEPRGFNTIKSHDKAIVKNWNSVVGEKDTVYVLGDLMLCDNDYGMSMINKLNGKIRVIYGNHDSKERRKRYIECPKIESVSLSEEIKYCHFHFFLCHYPVLVGGIYNYANKRWCLCGHTHSTDPWENEFIKCYNVALDANNMTPVLLDDIIDLIKDKQKEFEEMQKSYRKLIDYSNVISSFNKLGEQAVIFSEEE